ncbi:MAG TPA: polysaccharide deacetylase family protein, partial [Candidatus Saccharimonadales bacterium]|nr:polysaccharide deacetylase family protein [Candidatus Saccharimonadales bacterium]
MKALLIRTKTTTVAYFKRSTCLVAALTMAAGIVATATPTAYAQNLTPTPRISLTFDDGFQSALTKAAPVLKAHGLTGTNYVITDCVGKTTVPNDCAADPLKPYMTWDQISELKTTYGWEIGSHTATHPQLATDGLSDAQLETELAGSKATLAAHGIDATALAFPYGDYDNNVLKHAAKYYSSARGFADTDNNNVWPYNDALLLNQQVQTGAPAPTWSLCTDTTVAGVKACIDSAIDNNQWVVLTFHNIADIPEVNSESYDFSTNDLDQIAAYIEQKQNASEIKSVNISDGLVTGTNLLANGDFANGITNGWITDDAANITADANGNGRYPDPTHSISLKSSVGTAKDSHLFSPKVNVVFGKSYVLKNYLSMVNGGSVTLAIDEYDASGNWISWVDPNVSRTYNTAANAINLGDLSISYTPSSVSVASASLQVIVRHDANVQAYLDGSRWYDTSETDTTTPPADTTAPVVANVTITGTTATSTTISWTTDEASTAVVNYGTTAAYGQTSPQASGATSHSVTLTGLTASTNYQFQIVAKDAANNTNSATTGTFGTLATGTPGTFGD